MADKSKKIKFKQKDNNKISKNDIKNNKPTHLKFNYSFITNNNRYSYKNEEFNGDHKLNFLNRIFQLSEKELIEIMAYSKNIGLEFIEKKDFKKDIEYNKKFEDVEYRKKETDGKYAIFRLYPNNNPLPSRIIGKLINNVFYIMYLDLKHELYKG